MSFIFLIFREGCGETITVAAGDYITPRGSVISPASFIIL